MTRLSIAQIEAIAHAQRQRDLHRQQGAALITTTQHAPPTAIHERPPTRWVPSAGDLRGIPVIANHRPAGVNRRDLDDLCRPPHPSDPTR